MGHAGTGDVSIKNEHDEKEVKERAKAAILGAFVADAATMGMHWWVTIVCMYCCEGL